MRSYLVPVGVAFALVIGTLLHLTGNATTGDAIWTVALVLATVPLTISVASRMVRGQLGADVIALLAMIGSLILGQLAAGLVVALMLSGGELLDAHAFRRARRELTALAGRAPAVAHRREDGRLVDVPADDVSAGDQLLILAGEIVPVDSPWSAARLCSMRLP